MIPVEVIERAREAADTAVLAHEGDSYIEPAVSEALRSLLTDLREMMLAQDLRKMREDNGRREIYDGISALLRELGDE